MALPSLSRRLAAQSARLAAVHGSWALSAAAGKQHSIIRSCTSRADTSGYASAEFESPNGHEFEEVVDVGLSDVSYAAFVNRGYVAKYVPYKCTALQ
jgi:hypothetical protein